MNTLADIIKKNAIKYPDKNAIIFKEKKITYKELNDISDKIAFSLMNIGIKPKDKLGILLPNSINYAILYFGVTKAGGVITPFNPDLTSRELNYEIDYCDVEIIFTTKRLVNKISNVGNLKKIICFEDNEIKINNNKFINFNDFIKKTNNKILPKINKKSLVILLHTSGTTSNPKRVMLSHNNLIYNIRSNIKSLNLNKNDVVLISLPMFFGYANTSQFLTLLFLGGTVVLMDNIFIPAQFCQIVQKEKITTFTAVPTMLFMLQNFKNKDTYDISSLRYICFGGGVMPVDKLKKLILDFPSVKFIQTYGQTEASPRVTALLHEDSTRKIGSVGKSIPGVKVKIVDKNDNKVKQKEIGEIKIKGKNVMIGYYKNLEETKKVLRNGWLYSGDLAVYDNEGFIYLVGRKKNVIISGGKKIYPEEIEEYLLQNKKIKEILIIKENDDILGEIPSARVVLKEKIKLSTYELYNYCKIGLAEYKIPKIFYICDCLEKTYNNKLKR